jgi:hypothetical protein
MTWQDATAVSSTQTAYRKDNLQEMYRFAGGSGEIATTCWGRGARHMFTVTFEDRERLDGYTDWRPLNPIALKGRSHDTTR